MTTKKDRVVHQETVERPSNGGNVIAGIMTLGLANLVGIGDGDYKTTLVLDDGSKVTATGSTAADSVANAYGKIGD